MKPFFLLLSLILTIPASALSPDALFQDGNQAYQKGDYRTAAQRYEQVMREHRMYASDLYFNLGNAYYRLNDMPSAILNYERALREHPGDAELKYNLRLAQSHLQDKIEPVPVLFYLRWFRNLRDSASTDTWAVWSILFLFLSLAAWVTFRMAPSVVLRQIGFYSGIAILLLFMLSVSTAWSSYSEYFITRKAVVFAGNVSVKSAPVNTSTGLFIIHAGVTVTQTDVLGEWVKVRLDDGKEGWMPMEDLEYI